MPIYVYRCASCGKKKEKMMNSKDKPPSCCKQEMNRDYNHSVHFTINLRG